MKKIKLFKEFFDTQDLRDESELVDYSGNFLKKFFKKRKNEKSMKDAMEEMLSTFSEDQSHLQNKMVFLLRECSFLRSSYFKISNSGDKCIFDYHYKHEETSWRLLVIIDLGSNKISAGYEANIYGYEVVTERYERDCDNLQEIVKVFNDETVPTIKEWGDNTQKMTKVNPIAHSDDELTFSPSNN